MPSEKQIELLKEEINTLKKELKELKKSSATAKKKLTTVIVPSAYQSVFDVAEKTVGKYHQSFVINPEKATVEISGQRYLLLRASALSFEFLEGIMNYYRDRGEQEAFSIGKNMLFDLAHQIGAEDAKNLGALMGLKNPMEKLSAGPVHFAYTGWAQVKIMEGSNPTPDKNYVLKYSHPYSFEADSWIKAGKKSEQAVCVMNSGYSSGWCEHCFGINLTSVEITCRAKGDAECTFIMAPPDKIQKYLKQYSQLKKSNPEIPAFLKRKKMEEKLTSSLAEKELLLKEVHHRVKNNLQIISSLLNLQMNTITDPNTHYKFKESIDRINTMAVLQNLLYSSNNFNGVSVKNYFPTLVNSLQYSYRPKINIDIDYQIQLKNDILDIDKAIPCGLLLNEIVSNALKFAFEGRKSGKLKILFTDIPAKVKRSYKFVISDDGIGFKQKTELKHAESLGMQLIDSLVQQLGGIISIKSDRGTNIQIDF